MSVIVIARMKVERERFEAVFRAHRDEVEQISKEGQRQGAVHHQFVAGDGEVIIIDEWNNGDAFNHFFSTEERIPVLMAEAGVTEPPVISIHEVLPTADRF